MGRKNLDFSKAIKKVYKELDKKDRNWREKNKSKIYLCIIHILFRKKIACVRGKVEGTISKLKRK